jgi:hypothetical protein
LPWDGLLYVYIFFIQSKMAVKIKVIYCCRK